MHHFWWLCKNDVSQSVVTCHAIEFLWHEIIALKCDFLLSMSKNHPLLFLMFVLMLVLLYTSHFWCSRTSHLQSGHPSPNHSSDHSEVCLVAKWGWHTYIRHFYQYPTAYILVHQSTHESFVYSFTGTPPTCLGL